MMLGKELSGNSNCERLEAGLVSGIDGKLRTPGGDVVRLFVGSGVNGGFLTKRPKLSLEGLLSRKARVAYWAGLF